jgi:hypothetical protein
VGGLDLQSPGLSVQPRESFGERGEGVVCEVYGEVSV